MASAGFHSSTTDIKTLTSPRLQQEVMGVIVYVILCSWAFPFSHWSCWGSFRWRAASLGSSWRSDWTPAAPCLASGQTAALLSPAGGDTHSMNILFLEHINLLKVHCKVLINLTKISFLIKLFTFEFWDILKPALIFTSARRHLLLLLCLFQCIATFLGIKSCFWYRSWAAFLSAEAIQCIYIQ